MHDEYIPATTITTAALGSLVRAIRKPEEGWKRGVAKWLTGLITAIYLGPVICTAAEKLVGDGPKTESAVIFATGFLATEVLSFLEEWFLKWKASKK